MKPDLEARAMDEWEVDIREDIELMCEEIALANVCDVAQVRAVFAQMLTREEILYASGVLT